jgi:hypothetical protein
MHEWFHCMHVHALMGLATYGGVRDSGRGCERLSRGRRRKVACIALTETGLNAGCHVAADILGGLTPRLCLLVCPSNPFS